MQQLKQGTLLQGGKYRIERVLGQGGFGITYLVRNEMLNGYMALKEFFMKEENSRGEDGTRVTVPNNTKQSLFEEQRAKFNKEAQRMFALKNEHIVQIHDLFEENDTVYYTMDYIDGESLKQRMDHLGRPFNENEVHYYLQQILNALDAIHEKAVFHLDLKPDNIMVDKNEIVRLIDFGASKQLSEEGKTTTTAVCYTMGYAPAEQKDYKKDQIGPWTDIYALGATLYKMLTGNNPATVDVVEDGDGAFSFDNNISEKMKKLIIWMMQPQRKNRPQSVDEVLQFLQSDYTNVNVKKEGLKRPHLKKRFSVFLWGIELLLGLLLCVMIYCWAKPHGPVMGKFRSHPVYWYNDPATHRIISGHQVALNMSKAEANKKAIHYYRTKCEIIIGILVLSMLIISVFVLYRTKKITQKSNQAPLQEEKTLLGA